MNNSEKKQINSKLILPLEYNIIPIIIYVALVKMGEPVLPNDIYKWMKLGVFKYLDGIQPYFKLDDEIYK